MPNIITNYVKWVHNQGGVRGHGAGSGYQTFDTIPPQPVVLPFSLPVTLFPGESMPDPSNPAQTLYLAFCSVTNAGDGSHVIFPGDPTTSIPAGNQDMNVTYLYVPIGGGGTSGGPTVFIDAFDVNAGVFSNVVHIVDVSDPTLFTSANQNGIVPSGKAVHLEAVNPLAGVPFQEWKVIWGSSKPVIDSPDTKGLSIAKNNEAVCFIFYYNPNSNPPFTRLSTPAIWQNVSYATMVDGNPNYPMGPEMGALAASMMVIGLADHLDSESRIAILNTMARQVEQTAASMVNKIDSLAKGESNR